MIDPWFVLTLVVGMLALIGTGVAIRYRDESGPKGIAVALWVATIFAFFMSSFTTIPTKTVGIETSFGRPGTVLSNGWNWKAPTTVVHKFDASLQSDHYSTDKDDDGDPITVRLFTGSVASLNVTFQWRLEDDANFVQVYNNYREPEKIKTNLVKRGLQQALNDVFATYNPYAALLVSQASPTPGAAPAQVSASFDQMGSTALSRLKTEFAPQGVEAVSLTIASINYDDATQGYLNGLSGAIADTQIAIQKKATAKAQADSNALLNSEPATPATIALLCLQVTDKAMAENYALPTGWQCTGDSGVVITSGGK